jgi:hypothetical protein
LLILINATRPISYLLIISPHNACLIGLIFGSQGMTTYIFAKLAVLRAAVIRLLIALASFAISPAFAAFDNVVQPPNGDLTVLECAVWKATDAYVPDKDPVYKILVMIALDNGALKGLSVEHHHVSGMISDRSKQYEGSVTWQTPNRMEWWWKGYRGSAMMVGEIWFNQNWFYSEDRYENNIRKWSMTSRCHPIQTGYS